MPFFREKEIVICAAVKSSTGQIIRGHRHGDCYVTMKRKRLAPTFLEDGEGFITSRNRFVGREEALKLQKKADIESVCPGGYCDPERLFSEDLY